MYIHTWNKRASEAGMTLIELLVAMIIFGIVSTMLVTGWISLQRASAFAIQDNHAMADARDGLGRMSVELRDAQPLSMPTTTPSPTATPMPTPSWAVYTVAGPWEVDFYSAYNQPGAGSNGSGGGLGLTRIYLDTGGSTDQKTLYWQRDTNGNGVIDSGDRKMVLASNVVNQSIPSSPGTPIFTYGYRNVTTGAYVTTPNPTDLTAIISVQIRLITDINLAHTPKYIDLSTTVRPRNASGN